MDLFVREAPQEKLCCWGERKVSKKIVGRDGFTLIELSIYGTLLASISLLLFGFIGHMNTVMALFKHKNEAYIRYVLATDVLFRDVISASCAIGDWDKDNGVFIKETILSAGDITRVCIGWDVTPKGLVRHEGVYDFAKKVWLSKTTSYLSNCVTNILFTYTCNQKTKAIESISITLARNNAKNNTRNTIRESIPVRLRNGIIQGIVHA